MSKLFKFLVIAGLVFSFTFKSVPAQANDKVLHAGLSFVISTVAYNYFLNYMDLTENQSKVAAFVTTLAIGAAKEAIDDEFDGDDLAADAGGALLGVVIGFEF